MPILPHSHKGLSCWDYTSRCICMITLTTKPRENLFGECREWGIERNGFGKAVYDAWQAVERRFPMVRAIVAPPAGCSNSPLFSPTAAEAGRDRPGKERLEWLNAAARAISDFALEWART